MEWGIRARGKFISKGSIHNPGVLRELEESRLTAPVSDAKSIGAGKRPTAAGPEETK